MASDSKSQLKILGIIPARAGSSRLPHKNILPLAGKQMVCWVIEAAMKAKRLTRLIVSSDDERVLKLAAGYDPTLPLKRPVELATASSPAIDYVRHARQALAADDEGTFDIIVILQPSSPLTLAEDIDGTIDLLLSSGADSAVSVVKLDHAIHPAKLKTMDRDRLRPFIEEEHGRMAEHELPAVYIRNCSVYATRCSVIDDGQIIGGDCRGYVMPTERSIDINNELDYRFANFLVAEAGSDQFQN
jgi:CMP-N-acetylneuraminic acid synthetase